ncbi:MAG: AAA family ATPase [Gemmatimonadetes bacterium]|nr:AAA family ATPase [Gemmatimonadota bacterium]MYF72259.1 AAA family ATPase [Gemmatimonadota bacterium]MYK53672.1 AAA family ATPase [Gemmatimonadota bacterium]
MSDRLIRRLKIANFKSIDSLEITDLSSFSVFAGANGSGKSNFFDALDFVRLFVLGGIGIALRTHGGFANIHSAKRRGPDSKKFCFEIECDLCEDKSETSSAFHYSLCIHDLDSETNIEEYLYANGKKLVERNRAEVEIYEKGERTSASVFPGSYSVLGISTRRQFTEFLINLNVYRIEPKDAKEPDISDFDPTRLDRNGQNLASVLQRLEADPEVCENILEWMEMIVPGIENIQIEKQRLDGSTALLFQEKGTKRRFPAHLISDGTIYALSLLVAVLDAPSDGGMTLIEEPERGLHAKAIRELVDMMRQQASPENPIWLTTHSESVVRALKLRELILVDKVDGRTTMKRADAVNLSEKDMAPLGLDEVWLSNLLGGGLPW